MATSDKFYLNFDLKIDRDSASGEYVVSVAQSPVGETSMPSPLRLPFGAQGLENRLLKLKLALRSAGLTRKTAATSEEQEVQRFGGELFNAAFNADILALYRSSIRQAHAEGKGLRLRLRISSPELASLPWEFLYDATNGDYVCLSVNTPIVRYLDIQQSADPLTVTFPLRILGMIAAPTDMPGLDVEAERTRIEAALSDLIRAGRITIDWLPSSTHGALQTALNQQNYHVFHFIGHGGFDQQTGEGLLALTRDDGKAQLMPATNLARFLEQAGMMRLAFLNACEGATSSDQDIFSSTAATLVRRGIPAVLAMQYDITDEAAKLFARVFYEGIANGVPIDAAVSQARIAITGENVASLEWGTPVLTMRAPDGVLFKTDGAVPADSATIPSAQPRPDAIKPRNATTVPKDGVQADSNNAAIPGPEPLSRNKVSAAVGIAPAAAPPGTGPSESHGNVLTTAADDAKASNPTATIGTALIPTVIVGTSTYFLAGIGARFTASMIDGLILIVPFYIIGLITSSMFVQPTIDPYYIDSSNSLQNADLVTFVLWTLLGMAYQVYFWSRNGQTPGKRIAGVRVITNDGTPMNTGVAVKRYLGTIVSFWAFFIGYLVAFSDPQRRTWHDRIAGTLVVKA